MKSHSEKIFENFIGKFKGFDKWLGRKITLEEKEEILSLMSKFYKNTK